MRKSKKFLSNSIESNTDSRESSESFSLPIALTPKKTLLIGAGSVAWQKFSVLMEAQWEVCVWAKEICDDRFKVYFKANSPCSDNQIRHSERSEESKTNIYCTIRTLDSRTDLDSLKNFELIIDASGDANLGVFLHSVRKQCGFLLNVVDTPQLCDFYFGSIVRRGNVSVMVSTNGASPILSQVLRDKISAILPRTISALAHRLKSLRKTNPPKSKNAKVSIIKECENSLGKVFIIGCGPGDFGLLTLKALESFALLDVALVDNLIGDEILTHIKSLGIECVNVGKRKGVAHFTQEQINALMVDYARQGKVVGRLKGGDPVIFGRVWEEASFLHSHKIEVEYISGITSGLCGALYSGITPTLRGVSSGALIVSAHLRESVFHTEWLKWLKDSPYTLIVLMAHSFAKRICDEVLAQGISGNLPAAFISQVSLPTQKAIIGTLGELPQMAQMCKNPSILILGKAVEQSLDMPFMGERIVLDSAHKKRD